MDHVQQGDHDYGKLHLYNKLYGTHNTGGQLEHLVKQETCTRCIVVEKHGPGGADERTCIPGGETYRGEEDRAFIVGEEIVSSSNIKQ